MSDPAGTPPPARLSLAARLVLLPFHLFGVLCGSLLLSIVIECLGIAFFWPEQGEGHAREMLDYELGQFSEHFRQSALVSEPGTMARKAVGQAHEWLFVKSGLEAWRREVSGEANKPIRARSFREHLGRAYARAETYVIAAAYVALVFLARLLVLLLSLPLFLLAGLTGLVDGLARRDVRRFGAGRESGFVHHRARASLAPLAVLPWALYLALPVRVAPLFILLPGAALLGLA
ncbi:MAG: TIGR03747 family integrating conjugative element membrane protein, partial [Candidatus Accumulibacter sp.]|nr:TIGR03747 family integrating conjugative element membrane protein [Accumulibacter sp.]